MARTSCVKDRYFAKREGIVSLFSDADTEKVKNKIKKITDTGIREILLRHLESCGGNAEHAFSPEGVEEMNRNITSLNNGKQHQPIYNVRVYEKAEKYAVGKRGSKAKKFVEAEKDTNLFFAVYETVETNKATGLPVKKRSYATIPLYEAVKRAKAGLPIAPDNANGEKPAFVLSPNDLVYLPTKEDISQGTTSMPLDKNRIYKMKSSSGNQCFFLKHEVANSIVRKYEFSSSDKMERAITGEMIKETCIPIKVDRIGNIIEINGEKL